MDNVIDVPVVNDADWLLPTATLIPDGLVDTRSPLRPVAVTVKVALCGGGGAALPFTVSVAVREAPLAEAVMIVVRVV